MGGGEERHGTHLGWRGCGPRARELAPRARELGSRARELGSPDRGSAAGDERESSCTHLDRVAQDALHDDETKLMACASGHTGWGWGMRVGGV